MSTKSKLTLNRSLHLALGAGGPATLALTKGIQNHSKKRNVRGLAGLLLLSALAANQAHGHRLAKQYVTDRGAVEKDKLKRLSNGFSLRGLMPTSAVSELRQLYKDRKLVKTALKMPKGNSFIRHNQLFQVGGPIAKILKGDGTQKRVPFEPVEPGDLFAAKRRRFGSLREKILSRVLPEERNQIRKVKEILEFQKNPSLLEHSRITNKQHPHYGLHKLFLNLRGTDAATKRRTLAKAMLTAKHPILSKSEVFSRLYSGMKAEKSMLKKPAQGALSLGEMVVEKPHRLALEVALLAGSVYGGKKLYDLIKSKRKRKNDDN